MSKIGQQNAGMCSKIHGCSNPVFYKEPLSVPPAEEVFEDAEPNGEEEGEGHHADEGEPADVEEELDDIGEVAVTDDSVIDEPAIASIIGVKRVHSLSESEEDDDESYESDSDSMFSDSDPTFHA